MSHSEKSLWAGIGDSGHTASTVRKQTEDIRAQFVLLLGQDHTLLVVLPTFNSIFLLQLNLSGNTLMNTKRGVFPW